MPTTAKLQLLLTGYFRDTSASNHIAKEITDLIFSFCFLTIGSEMLTFDEEQQLMDWIYNSMKCDFKLLYKASRDGFRAGDFHEKCDDKGVNISIIKSKNGCIFGGYSSKSWHSRGSFTTDYSSWLYSLRNAKGIQKKLKMVQYQHFATSGCSNWGPRYGFDELNISHRCNANEDSYTYLVGSYKGASDPLILNGGTKHFKVLDYEIWQIIRK